MSNHLEDLVAQWLEFNGYFVRTSVLVGKREKGGFEGELDVIGFHPSNRHLIHVECSLDADPWERRIERFTKKFDRGKQYIKPLFHGLEIDAEVDQVALLQFGGGDRSELGGGQIIWVRDFISDVLAALAHRSPDKQAVPSTLPLLRTLQLAAQPTKPRKSKRVLIPGL